MSVKPLQSILEKFVNKISGNSDIISSYEEYEASELEALGMIPYY